MEYAKMGNSANPKDYKGGYVYILFNKQNGTLYTGVTSNLSLRMWEHKNKKREGFTAKYGIDKLGFYEWHNTITGAIQHEKRIKGGSRQMKLDLIENMNPGWKDLFEQFDRFASFRH